jgi:hypothetical protein
MQMTDEYITQLLDETRGRMAVMLGQRDALNIEIIQLQSKIKSYETVLDRVQLSQRTTLEQVVGISEAIRSILRIAARPMTAADVKNSLDLIGFDFSNFSNASAAVHSTLKRMASTDELIFKSEAKTYEISALKAAAWEWKKAVDAKRERDRKK